jgi:hypothetical protein
MQGLRRSVAHEFPTVETRPFSEHGRPVALQVAVKNVPTLIIKVFRILMPSTNTNSANPAKSQHGIDLGRARAERGEEKLVFVP